MYTLVFLNDSGSRIIRRETLGRTLRKPLNKGNPPRELPVTETDLLRHVVLVDTDQKKATPSPSALSKFTRKVSRGGHCSRPVDHKRF